MSSTHHQESVCLLISPQQTRGHALLIMLHLMAEEVCDLLTVFGRGCAFLNLGDGRMELQETFSYWD